MRPSEVRRHVLSDHADIQMMLERLDRVAQRVRRGEHPLLGPLRDGGEALLKTLGEHMLWEDRFLEPALREADTSGTERASRLAQDHREQRELLEFALERLRNPLRTPAQVASDIVDLIAVLREDMADEESDLLDERVLRDDAESD